MHSDYNFSSSIREKQIYKLQQKQFDLLIIGGGITGAGLAFDAVHRGLKVALIDKSDFASGTSSRSTKLVHGGLRYLQQLQFKFVVELGRERKILHNNNANNIIPTPMLLPIYKDGSLKKNLSLIALKIYDYLAGVHKEYKTQWIRKDQLLNKYTFLNKEGLKGALLYYEYKTNDGRMVVELLKQSAKKDLVAINHIQSDKPILKDGKIVGLQVKDCLTNEYFSIKSSVIVNASGTWCDKVLADFNVEMPKQLFRTKGVHIVLHKGKLPISDAFYFDAPDGRMIFAIPKLEHVYVGTTDTSYSGSLEHPDVKEDDIIYLLNALKDRFSGISISQSDIVSCWSGIRSLIKSAQSKPSEVSRKEEIFCSRNGLISITGGKLTGYRLMAKKVVDMVYDQLKLDKVTCQTQHLRFSGSEWEKLLSVDQLVEVADHKYDEAKQTGINAIQFKPIFYRYGTNIDVLIEKAYEFMSVEREPEKLWLKTELWYAVHFEMVQTLSSFFIYRTEMLLFEKEKVEKYEDYAASEMASWLKWNEKEKESRLASFRNEKRNYSL